MTEYKRFFEKSDFTVNELREALLKSFDDPEVTQEGYDALLELYSEMRVGRPILTIQINHRKKLFKL